MPVTAAAWTLLCPYRWQRPPDADGTDSYVLCEINVSSVFPIPHEAPAELARRVADRLRSKH